MAALRMVRGSKRVRPYLGGRAVADTTSAWLVWEAPHYPTYYLPLSDVTAELAETGQKRQDGERGVGVVYDVRAGGRSAPGAAVAYPDSPVPALRELVRLDWAAMGEWLEEDEPVYTHPRDPYHRVDVLAGSRHVRVEFDGQVVADSHRPTILFETGLPPRFYLPMPDIRMDLLHPSATLTHCPYKGAASYWSVRIGERTHEDVVWAYRTPLPECAKIAGLLCFYTERATLFLDGEHQGRLPPHPQPPG